MREIIFKKTLSEMTWDHDFWNNSGFNPNDLSFEEKRRIYSNFLKTLTDEQLFDKFEYVTKNADYWPQA